MALEVRVSFRMLKLLGKRSAFASHAGPARGYASQLAPPMLRPPVIMGQTWTSALSPDLSTAPSPISRHRPRSNLLLPTTLTHCAITLPLHFLSGYHIPRLPRQQILRRPTHQRLLLPGLLLLIIPMRSHARPDKQPQMHNPRSKSQPHSPDLHRGAMMRLLSIQPLPLTVALEARTWRIRPSGVLVQYAIIPIGKVRSVCLVIGPVVCVPLQRVDCDEERDGAVDGERECEEEV